jgi:hypothetical protein
MLKSDWVCDVNEGAQSRRQRVTKGKIESDLEEVLQGGKRNRVPSKGEKCGFWAPVAGGAQWMSCNGWLRCGTACMGAVR